MDVNKAPGPDGINLGFIKHFWNILHEDILQMASSFLKTGNLPRGLNSSFIVLIPKIKNPIRVTDFRPISLINCSLKVLLKALSNKLRRVLESVISEEQMAFVKGRSISNAVLLTSEIAHCVKSGQVQGVILKLDFSKTFETLDWKFLDHTLYKFGFGERWRSWISAIVSSTRLSVLINGSPTKEFETNRGLRQGNPLSPMLFDLVGEVLHILFSKEESLGLISGIKLGNGPSISHLQFADDTVIFLSNPDHSCKGVRIILIIFELLSGLRINFDKSYLFSAKKDDSKRQYWEDLIECQRGVWPFSYLGVNIGSSPKSKKFWTPIIHKVKTRLNRWKCKNLNKKGRTVMIKAVLNSLPVYWMQLFLIPSGVVKEIDKVRRQFF